jgi:hypothetical protein
VSVEEQVRPDNQEPLLKMNAEALFNKLYNVDSSTKPNYEDLKIGVLVEEGDFLSFLQDGSILDKDKKDLIADFLASTANLFPESTKEQAQSTQATKIEPLPEPIKKQAQSTQAIKVEQLSFEEKLQLLNSLLDKMDNLPKELITALKIADKLDEIENQKQQKKEKAAISDDNGIHAKIINKESRILKADVFRQAIIEKLSERVVYSRVDLIDNYLSHLEQVDPALYQHTKNKIKNAKEQTIAQPQSKLSDYTFDQSKHLLPEQGSLPSLTDNKNKERKDLRKSTKTHIQTASTDIARKAFIDTLYRLPEADVENLVKLFFPEKIKEMEKLRKKQKKDTDTSEEVTNKYWHKRREIIESALIYQGNPITVDRKVRTMLIYLIKHRLPTLADGQTATLTQLHNYIATKTTAAFKAEQDEQKLLQERIKAKFKSYGFRAVAETKALKDQQIRQAVATGELRLTDIIARGHESTLGKRRKYRWKKSWGPILSFITFKTFKWEEKEWSPEKARRRLQDQRSKGEKTQKYVVGGFFTFLKVFSGAGNCYFFETGFFGTNSKFLFTKAFIYYFVVGNALVCTVSRGNAILEHYAPSKIQQQKAEKEPKGKGDNVSYALAAFFGTTATTVSAYIGAVTLLTAIFGSILTAPLVIPIAAIVVAVGSGISFLAFKAKRMQENLRKFKDVFTDNDGWKKAWAILITALVISGLGILTFFLSVSGIAKFSSYFGLNLNKWLWGGAAAVSITIIETFSTVQKLIGFLTGAKKREQNKVPKDFKMSFESKSGKQKIEYCKNIYKRMTDKQRGFAFFVMLADVVAYSVLGSYDSAKSICAKTIIITGVTISLHPITVPAIIIAIIVNAGISCAFTWADGIYQRVVEKRLLKKEQKGQELTEKAIQQQSTGTTSRLFKRLRIRKNKTHKSRPVSPTTKAQQEVSTPHIPVDSCGAYRRKCPQAVASNHSH